MNRIGGVLAVSLLCLSPGAVFASEWAEFSNGSARLPGTLRVEQYVPALGSGTGRISIRPQLGLTRDGQAVLAMYTQGAGNPLAASNGVYTIRHDGTAWGAFPGGTGAVMAGEGLILRVTNGVPDRFAMATLPALGSTSANAAMLAFGGSVLQPLALYAEAYAGVVVPGTTAWQGRGTSLEPGGVSGAGDWGNESFDGAAALDNAGSIHIAWSQGSEDARAIRVARYRLGEWAGVGGGDTAVPGTEPGENRTSRQPSLGFSAGNPVVAWVERLNNLERVKVQQFNLTAGQWQGLGASLTEGIGFGRFPQVAHFEDRATFYVAFETPQNGALTVKRWQGAGWEDLGNPLGPWGLTRLATFTITGISNNFQPAVPSFAMALDRRGDPALAFRAESPAGSGRYHLFVSFYDRERGQWLALGNAADPLGASGLDYSLAGTPDPGRGLGHFAPTLTFTRDNLPLLAWEFDDASPSTPVVFMRRYATPVAPLPATSQEVIRHLLGFASVNPTMDDNEDGIVDAADVERLVSRGR